jgi:hypothetical protein
MFWANGVPIIESLVLSNTILQKSRNEKVFFLGSRERLCMTRKEFLRLLAGAAGTTVVAPTSSIRGTVTSNEKNQPFTTTDKGKPGIPRGFEVGNEQIARQFRSNGKSAFTTDLRARTTMAITSSEFALVTQSDGREVLLAPSTTRFAGADVQALPQKAELVWSSDAPALDVHVFYQTEGESPRIFKWIAIANCSGGPVRIAHAAVEVLEVSAGGEPLRGGLGQPVVFGNEFFFGIEHPAAANEPQGRAIILSHHPDCVVEPGKTWKSKRAVLGAAIENESVEDAFHRYLYDLTGRSANFAPISNDWGAHDELGTLVKPQLTEGLTFELLDQLESLKSEYGAEFAAYVLDAFWYDPQGAYLKFKQPNWPHGYEPALRRILAARMKPGLWFDLGGSTLDLKNTPGWGGPDKTCLSDPEFVHLLERALEFHTRQHSLGLIKLDFANLYCHLGNGEQSSLVVLERNADCLREVCDKARSDNPAMIILAFNVFSKVELMESTILYDEAYAASPWWLLWFDALYSGDPRPSELPSVTSLRDSVITYQDHVFRGFVRSWLPPCMIDDCGTIVGKTSTIYYLGSEGFTDSWILNIMRGTHSPTFYGDLRLLSESDRRFLAGSLRFLRENEAILAKTKPVLGVPGRGEVYGYVASLDDLALVTVVNPGLYPQSFVYSVSGQPARNAFQRLVFSNDGLAKDKARRTKGVLQGELVPGEIRIYALGAATRVSALALPPAPTRKFHRFIPLPDLFNGEKTARLKLAPGNAEMTLAIILRYFREGIPDRSFARPQEVCTVTGEIASKAVRFTSLPAEGTDVWSKCSWAVFEHQVGRDEIDKTLRLRLAGRPPAGSHLSIQAMWLQ